MADTPRAPQRLSRRVIWEGNVGSFGIDRIALPNGQQTELALLEHPGAAAVVPFLDPRNILLVHQYRHAAGGPIWEIPAGKLDRGEDPAACAARELEEETGYRPGRIEPCGRILTAPGFTDEIIWLFSGHDLERTEQRLEFDELIEVHTVSLERALEMISSGELIDAKTIAALHHVARRAGTS